MTIHFEAPDDWQDRVANHMPSLAGETPPYGLGGLVHEIKSWLVPKVAEQAYIIPADAENRIREYVREALDVDGALRKAWPRIEQMLTTFPVAAEAGDSGEVAELRDLPPEVRRLVHAVDRMRDNWNNPDSKWTNDELWRGLHQASDGVWGRLDSEAGDSAADETDAAIREALAANQDAPTNADPGDRVRLTIESTVQPNGHYVGKIYNGSGHDAETTFEVLRPAASVRDTAPTQWRPTPGERVRVAYRTGGSNVSTVQDNGRYVGDDAVLDGRAQVSPEPFESPLGEVTVDAPSEPASGLERGPDAPSQVGVRDTAAPLADMPHEDWRTFHTAATGTDPGPAGDTADTTAPRVWRAGDPEPGAGVVQLRHSNSQIWNRRSLSDFPGSEGTWQAGRSGAVIPWSTLSKRLGAATLTEVWTAGDTAEEPSLLDRFPEIAKARVRFWACSDHLGTGIVEWRGDIAYCMEDGCGRSSAPGADTTGEEA